MASTRQVVGVSLLLLLLALFSNARLFCISGLLLLSLLRARPEVLDVLLVPVNFSQSLFQGLAQVGNLFLHLLILAIDDLGLLVELCDALLELRSLRPLSRHLNTQDLDALLAQTPPQLGVLFQEVGALLKQLLPLDAVRLELRIVGFFLQPLDLLVFLPQALPQHCDLNVHCGVYVRAPQRVLLSVLEAIHGLSGLLAQAAHLAFALRHLREQHVLPPLELHDLLCEVRIPAGNNRLHGAH
mmetsp:Transcript_88135/g.189210  ORF Transcript_88135/g.189210 Transcript_88135/m.189210 type:complete len:242 (-) Transcript_88135:7-732(-)